MPTGFHRIAAAMVAVAVATTSCSRLAQAQSAPAWAYPVGTSTGVPAVDAVLRATETHDAAALSALFRFTLKPCTEPGLGEIECPVGRPVGTPVEIFPPFNASVRIAPSTGPTQGAQPAEKNTPIKAEER